MVAQRHTVNPRTVLGFYATIISVVFAGVLASVTTLAINDVATWLIPWILGVGFMIVISVIGVVAFINIKKPANLMLGQISGREYAEISRVTLGDDQSGERVVQVEGVIERGVNISVSEPAARLDVEQAAAAELDSGGSEDGK